MMLLHRTKLAGKSNAGTTCHFTDLTLNSVYVLVSFLLWSLASFLIRWFVFTFLLSVARSLVRSFVTEVTRSFVCLFACQLIRLFARLSFAHSVTRTLLVCSFGGSHFVRSFVRSLARSFSRYEGYSVASVGKFRSITLAFIKHDTALHKREKRGKLKQFS